MRIEFQDPNDVVFTHMFLPYLEPSDLIQLRAVSKSWFNIVMAEDTWLEYATLFILQSPEHNATQQGKGETAFHYYWREVKRAH